METKPIKIAEINLTERTICSREVDRTLVNTYLGGTGLGLALLRKSGDPSALLFLTGPLTDAPQGGRFCAVARSPVDGQLLTPTSGNGWGVALKRAGWDGILLEGKASEWVSLQIDGNTIRQNSAAVLLGLSASETEARMPGCTVLAIGPAGEREVPLSAIYCGQHHAFSRGGIGAVMGAKKLKAIGVSCRELPEHACARCSVRCSHAEGKGEDWADVYGMDAVGVAKVAEAARELRAQGAAIPEWELPTWAARISNPTTELDRLAGQGAETLRSAYGRLDSPIRKKRKKTGEQTAILDVMGCCLFSAAAASMEKYVMWLTQVGIKITEAELTEIGKCCAALKNESS